MTFLSICPSCRATLDEKSSQSGRCPRCGQALSLPGDAAPDISQTIDSVPDLSAISGAGQDKPDATPGPTGPRENTGTLVLGPNDTSGRLAPLQPAAVIRAPAQPAAPDNSQTIDSIPDLGAIAGAGQDKPAEPPAQPPHFATQVIPSSDTAGRFPSLASPAPDPEQPPAAQPPDISQTIDSVPDLGALSGPGGVTAVPPEPPNPFATQMFATSDTAGRLPGQAASPPAPGLQASLSGVPHRTITSTTPGEPGAGPGAQPGGGTFDFRAINMTCDLDVGTPSQFAQQMTGMWEDALAPDSRPHLTLKGKELQSGTVTGRESHLVISSRGMRDVKETAAVGGAAPSTNTDYELIEVLGKGGMGVVYTARQASIDRTVALKMLREDFAKSADHQGKFLAEAVVTGELDHPNIVPIYDLGSNEKGLLFYSMKKVQGTPWHKALAKKTQVENVEILMKVADAVGFAHSRGVVHRDLKPENIMLGDFGEVLVMDWGLALPTASFRKTGSIHQTTSMGGTPAYMAPEMATGPLDKVGPSADIYLLGAMLYEIVAGFPPHSGKDVMSCLFSAGRNEILPTDKSGELVDIARKAMATSQAERYATVRDFQGAIRDYQSHSESVILSARASEELAEAEQSRDYQAFSRALFAFEEAYALWDKNAKAKNGISAARLAYATCARDKGDLDLAASLLVADEPTHGEMRAQIAAAQREREARVQRLKNAKRMAVGLVAAIVVILTVAVAWINSERNAALIAEGQARDAEKVATTQKEKAVRAEKVATTQKEKAVRAERVATAEKEKAVRAEKIARSERDRATRAKEAEEREAYVARIGAAAARISENSFDQAERLLDDCKPVALRHWEWGRLKYLCRQSVADINAGSPVDAVAFSPDGQRFAAGGWDGQIRIWNASLEQPEVTISYGGQYVHAVAFSRDGRYVAAGGSNPDVYAGLWDAATGELVRSFPKKPGAAAPDSKALAAAGGATGHTDDVTSVVFSPKGDRLLTTSYDNSARLWDVATGRELRAFQGHHWWVWDAAFSPDEKLLVTASQDGTAIVWSLDNPNQKLPPVFAGHVGPVYAVAFSPDGKHVISGGYDNRVLIWDVAAAQPIDYKKRTEDEPIPPPAYRALEGHTAAVRTVRFSPNGKLALSGAHDNTVKIWDGESGKLIKTLRGHSGRVRAAEFAPPAADDPDARSLSVLSGSHDQEIKLWNIAGYQEVRVLQGRVFKRHKDAVLSAAFSPDGTRIVTASRDRTAKTWDFTTGDEIGTFREGHEFLASSAVFLPGDKRVVTIAVDNSTRIWDVATGAELAVLEGPTGRSAALALSHDAKWILTGADDEPQQGQKSGPYHTARLWDAETGRLLKTFSGHEAEVTAVAFSPDDRTLYTGDSAGHGRLWDAATGQVLRALEGHTRKIVAAAFTPDGQRVLTASMDKTVGQWYVETGEELPNMNFKHPDAVLAMALSPDGRLAVTSCQDGAVRVWDVERARVVRELKAGKELVNSVGISPDSRTALTAVSQTRTVRLWDLETGAERLRGGKPFLRLADDDGLIWSAVFSTRGEHVLTLGGSGARLWELETGQERMSFSPHGAIASAAFSPDGKRVITGSWDSSARVWNAATGKDELKLTGHDGYVNSALFSPDGEQVLTCDESSAKLWNSHTGELLVTFKGHGSRVWSAAFSTDGSRVVTASQDRTARIWDARSGKQLGVLKGHAYGVLCARFSADGRRVITGSEDNTARIWDVAKRKLLVALKGHTAPVTSVAFTPLADGRRVLTGSRDNTAKIWDAETGKEILRLPGHTQEVTSVAFSPDGRHVLTASQDGAAILWLAEEWRAGEMEEGKVAGQQRLRNSRSAPPRN